MARFGKAREGNGGVMAKKKELTSHGANKQGVNFAFDRQGNERPSMGKRVRLASIYRWKLPIRSFQF
jgi:hypothetical protein